MLCILIGSSVEGAADVEDVLVLVSIGVSVSVCAEVTVEVLVELGASDVEVAEPVDVISARVVEEGT